MPSSTSSSERALVPQRPLPPRVRGGRPLAVALFSFALAFSAWLTLVEPRLPEPPRRRPHPSGELAWFAGGRVPAYLKGEARAGGWLVLGDSRVQHGIDEERLAALGIEPLAVLWVGGGQLDELLAAARELPPRRLLVALSPLSLHRHVVDPESERGRALALSERSFSQRVDEQVDQRFEHLRSALVRWIDTRGLERAWLDRAEPHATDFRQRRALSERTRAARDAELVELARVLGELRAEGREIFCMRMPLSPSLRAIEDEALEPTRFVRLCAELGIPYLDLGTSEPTADGSHLTAAGARALAPRLAAWLRSH